MRAKYKYRSFMPWPENEQRLADAKRLGINVSELINEVLNERLETALRGKTEKLQKELNMVRDTGFEPVTPTVSKYRSKVQSLHRAPLFVAGVKADNGIILTVQHVGTLLRSEKVPVNGNSAEFAGLPAGTTAGFRQQPHPYFKNRHFTNRSKASREPERSIFDESFSISS
jgi:hypothetical protein